MKSITPGGQKVLGRALMSRTFVQQFVSTAKSGLLSDGSKTVISKLLLSCFKVISLNTLVKKIKCNFEDQKIKAISNINKLSCPTHRCIFHFFCSDTVFLHDI